MQGGGRTQRAHGPFAGDIEAEKVVNFLKSQSMPKYQDITTPSDQDDQDNYSDDASVDIAKSGDRLYNEAVAIVLKEKRVSISYIQRCLRIGCNKSASLVEKMEKEGIISEPSHTDKRYILIDKDNDTKEATS